MAVQDYYNHPISWEEKKFFNNTSFSGTEKGTAKYVKGPDGRPEPQYLTQLGLKHFGYESDASYEREESKESHKSSCCDCGCCCCFKCLLKILCCFLPFAVDEWFDE